MICLGEWQELIVVKRVDFGIYLAEQMEDETRVLLPKKQVPEGIRPGDHLRVFLYKDSKDRLIATLTEPKLTLGKFAVLKVLEVGKIGAFLDWGLEKDLFLPYKEMTARVSAGDEVLVTIYIDKSRRLCASMKGIYELLATNSPYRRDDTVEGRVYEFSDNFGAFVAVDDKYSALIPSYEDHSFLHIGDVISAKVTNVKEDGKLDLTLRERAYIQMDDDAKKVLSVIEEFGVDEPKSMTQVAHALNITTGTLTKSIDALVEKKYVERHRSNQDKRVIRLSLTDAGVRAYEHHARFHANMIEDIKQELDEDETRILIATLGKLVVFFQDKYKEYLERK